jgi:hypothetical protein
MKTWKSSWTEFEPRVSYNAYTGNIRGNYSFTNNEITFSGKLSGTRFSYFYWFSYTEWGPAKPNTYNRNYRRENGQTSVRDIMVNLSTSYNLSNANNRLNLGECIFLVYELSFPEEKRSSGKDTAPVKYNKKYHTTLTRVN